MAPPSRRADARANPFAQSEATDQATRSGIGRLRQGIEQTVICDAYGLYQN
jgi:hypothetical protein